MEQNYSTKVNKIGKCGGERGSASRKSQQHGYILYVLIESSTIIKKNAWNENYQKDAGKCVPRSDDKQNLKKEEEKKIIKCSKERKI